MLIKDGDGECHDMIEIQTAESIQQRKENVQAVFKITTTFQQHASLKCRMKESIFENTRQTYNPFTFIFFTQLSRVRASALYKQTTKNTSFHTSLNI